jgi:hypothetical protein
VKKDDPCRTNGSKYGLDRALPQTIVMGMRIEKAGDTLLPERSITLALSAALAAQRRGSVAFDQDLAVTGSAPVPS